MIEPLTDATVVTRVLRHPAIVGRIRHEGREPGFIDHPAVSYAAAKVKGQIVGVFTLIRFTALEIEVHAAILPHAVRYSRLLGRELIAHVFATTEAQRLTAYIIQGLESARNYCLKLGFKAEGFRRDACRKDGRLVGVHVLGLTRSDWEK